MKKVLSLLLVLLLTFTITGCAKDDTFTVALLVPGAVTDGGWSQSAYEGLLAVEEELEGVEIRYTENVTSANAEKVMADYARAGVEVVIGHGMEYFDIADAINEDYEDTFFVITSTTAHQGPNIGSIKTNVMEMGFIAGYMLYEMGHDEMIFFESAPYTSIIQSGWGAVAGFEYAHSMDSSGREIKTDIVLMNNNNDVSAAKTLALTMANSADWDVEKLAFCSNSNDATRGSILAAEELGIPMVGFYSQKQEESDYVLMDVLTDNNKTFIEVVKLVMDGEAEGINYNFGVADDVVFPTDLYTTFADGIPAGLQDTLDQLVADIASGALDATQITKDWAEANGEA